uniref:Phorbol-ester/DAG-type domain-containing protein n=1 Tax=Daucus carota subsp. sativus TaxID=79200 RepID=A0A166BCC9_DAUCS
MANKEIQHCNSHRHPLTLKENYHPNGDFVCLHCNKAILCKSSVYTCEFNTDKTTINAKAKDADCAGLFLHKNCTDLSIRLMHPTHKHILTNNRVLYEIQRDECNVCSTAIGHYSFFYCCTEKCEFKLCLRCALTPSQNERKIQHWSHQHQLRVVERCATFECDAWNKVATESSYMCDICPFWIHKSCGSLPRLNILIHHKHPLWLSDSLPDIYRQFQQFCKICKVEVDPRHWLFYCANCRFFAHIQCALSRTLVLRHEGADDDAKIMHVPAADEQSLNYMKQTCIKDMISLSVDISVSPPILIDHWAHEHPLALEHKSASVITMDYSNQESSVGPILCDGCTKPISSSSDDANVLYKCNQCSYALHRYCALIPQEMNHSKLGMLKVHKRRALSNKLKCCESCNIFSNGFMFRSEDEIYDVGCVCLPEKIKHITHHHPLKQRSSVNGAVCKACSSECWGWSTIVYGCEICDFSLHSDCALKPRTVPHRWDPHPLRLILSIEDDVEDHPHDFECEFCSQVIDTNTWFYHCNICDLSFHMFCIDPYFVYANVKFGATGIKKEDRDLTLVLNKKGLPALKRRSGRLWKLRD